MLNSFYQNFQTLSRLLAHAGATVVMPDFRNSATPSLQGEVTGSFPSGLNDCVSTVRWCRDNLDKIHASHIIIAGESGGGNLAISTALSLAREGEMIIKGVYSLCPMIRGAWGGHGENHDSTSWNKNAGIFMDYPEYHPVVKDYGMGSKEKDQSLHDEKNALAWPGLYADPVELQQIKYPPTAIVVNEFDPLLDDGVEFYNKCIEARIQNCSIQQLDGTTHGVGSYLVNLMPEVSRDQCNRIVAFAKERFSK
jgi:acetyl esterase/lipase